MQLTPSQFVQRMCGFVISAAFVMFVGFVATGANAPAQEKTDRTKQERAQPKTQELPSPDEKPQDKKPQEEKPQEEPPAEIQDPQAQIQAVYKKTQDADSFEDYDAIVKQCQSLQAAKLDEKQSAYAKRLLAWALNRRGEAYADQATDASKNGDMEKATEFDEKALADFEASIENDPTKWKAYNNRGVSRATAGRMEDALADFNKAIELYPRYAKTYFNRGEVNYQLGRLREAISDYNRALQLKSDDAPTYTSRANTLYEMASQAQGDSQRRQLFQQALRDFDRAVELDPQNALAYANRADVHSTYRNWGQAISDYVQALRLNPSLGRAYQGAGWIMATCPDSRYRHAERALQYAQRAIQLDGEENYLYLDTLAAAQANDSQFEQARQTLTKALAIAPETAAKALNERMALYRQNRPYRQ